MRPLTSLHAKAARSAFAAGLACVLVQCVLGAEATLMGSELTRDEPGERPGLFVEAHYEFTLPQPLIDVLHRGIALYFNHEFRLHQEKWYWFDKLSAESRFIIRLSFDPLTRRYRVAYNGLSINFDSLEQALPYIKSIRRWRVAPPNAIAGKQKYRAEIRFYLDTGKLPKPMQVTTNDSVEWTVASDWENVEITGEIVESGE